MLFFLFAMFHVKQKIQGVIPGYKFVVLRFRMLLYLLC